MIKDTWYLLYDGISPDGRGTASFVGRTTDRDKALRHVEEIEDNPYSTGYVTMVTDEEVVMVTSKYELDL